MCQPITTPSYAWQTIRTWTVHTPSIRRCGIIGLMRSCLAICRPHQRLDHFLCLPVSLPLTESKGSSYGSIHSSSYSKTDANGYGSPICFREGAWERSRKVDWLSRAPPIKGSWFGSRPGQQAFHPSVVGDLVSDSCGMNETLSFSSAGHHKQHCMGQILV